MLGRSTAFSSPSVVPLDCGRTCCGAEVFGLVPLREFGGGDMTFAGCRQATRFRDRLLRHVLAYSAYGR